MRAARNKTKLPQAVTEELKQFSVATGIPCLCLSKGTESCPSCMGFCRAVSALTGKPVECREALTYGAYQAERFHGRYIFYCPMGLVHFASPVFFEGRVFAAAVCGPVLLIDKDEYIVEDVIARLKIDPVETKELIHALKGIEQLPPERVTALSQILFAVCSHLSGTEQLLYLNDEEEIGNDISKYIHLIQTMGGTAEENAYPIEKERSLLSFITVGNRERAGELLNELLRHIVAYSNRDFGKAKARILELVVLLSRAALEGGADTEQIFGLNYRYLKQIDAYKTVEELSHWLSDIMVRFNDCVFNLVNVKHKDTIYKAVDYIRHHYAERITLEEAAEHVSLSPPYFSKLFSEELDISFNNYLNQIRVENSKRFLLGNELDMSKIAEMTGFSDQSYFTKVFKKITGVTPGTYRKRHGKIQNMV